MEQFIISYYQGTPNNDVLSQLVSRCLVLEMELAPKLQGDNKRILRPYLKFFDNPNDVFKSDNSALNIFGLVKAIREAMEVLNIMRYD